MPMSRVELLEEFGRAADFGNAAVFVGAGLSRGAGLPDWGALLEGPAAEANIPMGPDLPLVAEYIRLSGKFNDDQLATNIRGQIIDAGAVPGAAHVSLARLPVDQVWTTNYDTLIEQADPEAELIVTDDHVRRVGSTRRSLIKMHGSIAHSGWATAPVITRRHYETYQETHPRTWALLRATYLSRTMLFLGFSFTDPNIDILLQLARTLGTAVGDRHMTVMRRPQAGAPEIEQALHDLRVRDLETSGVHVHEIEEFDELADILAALVRRTRPQRMFLSGSFKDDDLAAQEVCRAVATALAARGRWTLVSLAGPTSWHISSQLADHRRAEDQYDAQQFEFHYRGSTRPPEPATERLGTAIYHGKTREELGPWLLDECRAMLVVGGGTRTLEEIAWAEAAGVPVIPLGRSGGSAHTYWERLAASPPAIGGQATPQALWARLGHEKADVAARAALKLLDRAMYHSE